MSYDSIGNITLKSDVGNYAYNASGSSSVRPHAVNAIGSSGCTANCMNDVLSNGNYYYDTNGNLQCITAAAQCDTTAARTITYSSFNMTASVYTGAATNKLVLSYDPDHARAQMCVPDCVEHSLPPTITQYMNDANTGSMSELVTIGASSTWRTYIMADGKLVAERFRTGTNSPTMLYFITDHLGSVAVVTDVNGAVLTSNGRLYYDPWGKMKNASGSNDTSCSLPAASRTTRGFTGQEQMANVCLDNYNARVYDPTLGRFLAPDSVIPDTYAPQSLNRYTYVDNMPLSETDPTGHDGGPGFITVSSDATVAGESSQAASSDASSSDNADQTAHGTSATSGSSSSGNTASQSFATPGSTVHSDPDSPTGAYLTSPANSPQAATIQGLRDQGAQFLYPGNGGTFYYISGSASFSTNGGGGYTSAVVQSAGIATPYRPSLPYRSPAIYHSPNQAFWAAVSLAVTYPDFPGYEYGGIIYDEDALDWGFTLERGRPGGDKIDIHGIVDASQAFAWWHVHHNYGGVADFQFAYGSDRNATTLSTCGGCDIDDSKSFNQWTGHSSGAYLYLPNGTGKFWPDPVAHQDIWNFVGKQ